MAKTTGTSNRTLISAWLRGMAIFMGLFTILNIVGEWRSPNFDLNLWWIDVRPLPALVGQGILAVGGAVLVWLGFWLPADLRARAFVASTLGVLILLCVRNALLYNALRESKTLYYALPGGLSLVWALALFVILLVAIFGTKDEKSMHTSGLWVWRILGLGLSIILFPLAQIVALGTTDYRRPADVIVVLGARAYVDGTPSQALADRTNTGIMLQKQHYAPILFFSGGPGDGPLSEPQVMQKMARQADIPDSALQLDPGGMNTEATAEHVAAWLQQHNQTRVLVVSHFWHLPRVRMSLQRAGVKEVYTVPCAENQPLVQTPQLILREIVALWTYYLRPLWQN